MRLREEPLRTQWSWHCGRALRPWPACMCVHVCTRVHGVHVVCACTCLLTVLRHVAALQHRAKAPQPGRGLHSCSPSHQVPQPSLSLSYLGWYTLEGAMEFPLPTPRTQMEFQWYSLWASVSHQPVSLLRTLFTTCKTFISLSLGFCMGKDSYFCRIVVHVK